MRTAVLLAILAVGRAATAAEPPDPITRLGRQVLGDFKLKWAGAVPEFAPFEAAETAWDPWAVIDADASLARQTGRLKLGLGIGRLGWHLESITLVEGTAARVKLRLGLDLGAGRLMLRLPDVKVTPRFDKGQVGFDWVIPIVEQRF